MKIEYVVDGQRYNVDPKNEQAFLKEMEGKKIEKTSKEPDKEESGKQEALLGDATVEQTSKASNQEVSQPQNNQEENTESSSENTSSESQEDKLEYFYEGKTYRFKPQHESAFIRDHKGAIKVQEQYKPDYVDTFEHELSSDFEHMSLEDMVKAVGNKNSLTQEEDFVRTMNEHYKDQPIKFEQARVGSDAVRVLIGNKETGKFDKSHVFYLNAQAGNRVDIDASVKSSAQGSNNLGLSLTAGGNPEVMQDILNHIDMNTNAKLFEKANKELVNILGNQRTIEYQNDVDNMQEFYDALDNYQGIQTRERRKYDAQQSVFTKVIDSVGTINIGGREFSYNYLWQNRKDIADIVNGENIKKVNTNKSYAVSNIYNEKGDEGVTEYIQRNNTAFFNIEPQELKKIGFELERLRAGKTLNENNEIVDISDEDASIKIKELTERKNQIIRDNNFEDLYDDKGNFIKLFQDWVPDEKDSRYMVQVDKDGNFTGNRRLADKSDDPKHIEKLAENDRGWLEEEQRKAYYKLVYYLKKAHDNIDEVEKGQGFVLKNWAKLFDEDNDSFDNFRTKAEKAFGEGGTGDIFGLGGYNENNRLAAFMSDINPLNFSKEGSMIDDDDLPQISGGSPIAKEFNQALMDFKSISLALDLNINPLEANIEGFGHTILNGLGRAWTGENLVGGSYSESQLYDNAEHIFKAAGYDHEIIQNNSWYGRGDEGAAATRSIADMSANTVTALTPLLAELAVFKKLGGLKKLNKVATALSNKTLTKPRTLAFVRSIAGRSNSRLYEDLVRKVGIPMLVTPIEWSAAEYGGEVLLADGSGLWDAHTFHVDKETGDIKTNFLFPMAMGASGGLLGIGSAKMHEKFIMPLVEKGWVHGPVYNRITTKLAEVTGKPGAVARAGLKSSKDMLAGGATATLLLTAASAVEQVRNDLQRGWMPWKDLSPQEQQQRKDEWLSFTNMEHLVATTIGMSFVGAPKIMPKVAERFRNEMARVKNETVASKAAAKDLGFKESDRQLDKSWDSKDITKKRRDKVQKSKRNIEKEEKSIKKFQAEQKKLEDKRKNPDRKVKLEDGTQGTLAEKLGELQTKIENSREKIQAEKVLISNYNTAAKTLRHRNDIIAMQKGLKSEAKYREYLKNSYSMASDMLSAGKSPEQLDRIGKMSVTDFEGFLLEKGIKGKPAELHYTILFNSIKNAIALNKGLYRLEGKAYDNYIKDRFELTQKELQLEMLQVRAKDAPGHKSRIKSEIKDLKEQIDFLTEEIKVNEKSYSKDFERRLKNYNKHLKETIEAEGKTYEGLESTESFKAMVESKEIGGQWEMGMNAFISKDGKKIFVDLEQANKNKSLTEGLHEVTHMLLYNHLKTVNSKGERVVSKSGIRTIDAMLDMLPGGRKGEAFKMIQDRIDLNYRYNIKEINESTGKITFETKNGKKVENKKETYYEEYVTILSQLIKEKKIKPSVDMGRRLGKVLYPVLSNFGPFKGMYKFDINQKDSRKAGADLMKFVEWIGTKGLTENVLELGRGKGFVPGKTTSAGSIDYASRVSRLKAGSEAIIQKNIDTNNRLVQQAKSKFGKDWKEILTSESTENKAKQKEFLDETAELRFKIVEDNLNIAHLMADHPSYGGKGRQAGGYIPPEVRQQFFEKFKGELENLARTYNPAMGVPIGAYLIETIKFRYPKIMDQIAPSSKTKSLTTEDGKQYEIEDITNYDKFESENILEIERRQRQAEREKKAVSESIMISELRRKIGIEDGVERDRVITEVMRDVRLLKFTKKVDGKTVEVSPMELNQKQFYKILKDKVELSHVSRLSKLLPREVMISEAMKDVILKNIPISELRDMQKQLPQGQVFVEALKHPTKSKWGNTREIEEFMGLHGKTEYNPTGENLLPEMKKLWDVFSKVSEANGRKQMPEFIEYDKKIKSGFPNIWRRRDVPVNIWEQYVNATVPGKRQKSTKSGSKWNNWDNVIRKLSTSMTTDAIPEILSDKAFVKDFMEMRDMKYGQVEAKALIERFVNNINKNQGLQFSKNIMTEVQRKKFEKQKASMEMTQAGADQIKRMLKLVNKIAEVGIHNVYDFKSESKEAVDLDKIKLNEKYKDLVEPSEAKFIFEKLFLRDKIFNHEGNIQIKNILDGVDAGRKRSIGFEQFIINQFKLLKNVELVTEIQTEKGDMADVAAKLFGKIFNIEVKMPNARLGSFTAGIDIKNGVALPVTTLNFNKVRDRAQIESLLKETVEGWKNIRKHYIKLSKTKGISARDKKLLENFDKHSDPIPSWAYESALKADLYNQARSKGNFTEKLIEDMYKYKSNPSSHMLWLGRGLLHLGKNTMGLETTKLTGDFAGSWGMSKGSVKSAETKHPAFVTKKNPLGKLDGKGLVRTSLRFIPVAKHVTSKNSKIDVFTKQGIENFKNSISAVGKMVNASKKVDAKITASKAIENVRDFIKGKERRGMSTFDFDDTLAMTKSGVRVTMPNPSGAPKPSRKVIFLAGGAGSGKGNVISKLGLEKQGFKIVNSDISLEWLKKNHGLPENMKDLTKEQRSILGKLGHQARGIAKRKMMKFQGNANGVVVDGTGGSVKSMEKLVAEFKSKGYDTSMLFVETSLQTALERNRNRKERSLLDKIVERNHEAVQKNKPTFAEMFGERFMEVKTDNLKQTDAMPKELVEKMKDFVNGYEKMRIDAEQFASEGERMKNKGAEFDFTEFNEVVKGEQGPFFKTAIERAKKFGTKDMFVLTARPAEAASAIHEFLKSQGLNIPIENITGLANSTGNAKAKWMLEKFAEGYNDMYFVDDALQNVDAVKKVLEQLDVKSRVVQAKIQKSKDISAEINKMLGRQSKIDANRKITLAEARLLGRGKGKFDYFVPPSAEDFKGLMYKLLGKGEQGNKDMKFFKENLFDPFAKGMRDLNVVKQKMSEEYKTLKKDIKDMKLDKTVGGTPFTVDHAVRMYLWDKAGFEVPGIGENTRQLLIDHVNNNPRLVRFAETLSSITRLNEGYIEPSKFWEVESIGADLNNIVKGNTRKNILAEWIDNKNLIFSPENMNKIEAIHGKWYRESLENILYRMETGTNRLTGIEDGPTKMWMDWVNGSVGATMFWNTRSAVLQTISMVNFTNYAENNIFAQARAFSNQKQFWKDFAFIMNSPMLKQRRAGLAIDVSASELTNMFKESGKDPRSILKYLLEKGFTPTRVADSFAIAMGGAGFYRNRLNMYLKRGMKDAKAKERAWLDFQERAEETQQSSRPDLISQQQAGPLGRLVLAWQNTPMQMTRLMKKSLSDIVNRRKIENQTQVQSDISNLSRILYYGAIQNLWFGTLQSGLAWLMFGSDMEDKVEKAENKVINGALDTLLRGTGIYGAIASTIKNTLLRYQKEKNEPRWKRDMAYVGIEAMQVSPPIGSKIRKAYNAIEAWQKYDAKAVSKEIGLRIENPEAMAVANLVEAATNIPIARTINKVNNLEEAFTGSGHENWQRIAMISGWSRWNVGAKDEELEAAKEKAKASRPERNKKKREDEKKEKGLKQVRCSGTKSSGGRCGNTTWTDKKSWKCAHHMAFKDGMDRDGDGIKEYQCKATTSSGRRCRNKTENKNKRCYAHQ
jgi:hypothetical protein